METPPTAVFRDLNRQQSDGLSCVVCNAPFHVPPAIESVPVGVAAVVGGQVFACNTTECAVAIGYVPISDQLPLSTDCGPGCCAPVLGVHDSCPGPLVGQTVESAR
jgi:hypothetical protein